MPYPEKVYTAICTPPDGEVRHSGSFLDCWARLLKAGHGRVWLGDSETFPKSSSVVSLAWHSYEARGESCTDDQWRHIKTALGRHL